MLCFDFLHLVATALSSGRLRAVETHSAMAGTRNKHNIYWTRKGAKKNKMANGDFAILSFFFNYTNLSGYTSGPPGTMLTLKLQR